MAKVSRDISIASTPTSGDCSRYAGDYVGFGRCVRSFFECLKACNVTPYVIMDGGIDPSLDKLHELKSRAKCDIRTVRTRPGSDIFVYGSLLDTKVFREVVVDMGIYYRCSLFEADGDVAHLANRFSCPVLAEDSDFMVFDLEGGYIPLSKLNYTNHWQDVVKGMNEQRPYLECKVYSLRDYARSKRVDKDVFPLIALHFGYDLYQPPTRSLSFEEFFQYHKDRPTFQLIDEYLKSDPVSRYEELHKSYEFYHSGCHGKCLCYRYPSLKVICKKCDEKQDIKIIDHKLDEDLTSLVKSGQLDPTLLNYRTTKMRILRVQAEDLSMPSSYTSSFNLQRYVVSLMRMSDSENLEMTNWDRSGDEFESVCLTANTVLPNGKACPTFKDMATMSREEKEEVFFSILRIDKNVFNSMAQNVIRKHPLENNAHLQLISLATILRSARQEANFSDVFCIAMIVSALSYLYIEDSRDEGTAELRFFMRKLTNPNMYEFDVRLVHPYCEFQTIYLVILQICGILDYPMADIKPNLCLSGTLIANLQQCLSQEASPTAFIREMLRSEHQLTDIFNIVLEYVTLRL
ncbi:Protein asteroid -like protein 1 [Halotydeus destructor]|nr:Protein asteroid -like protein 1 [Halotydeus destructor]